MNPEKVAGEERVARQQVVHFHSSDERFCKTTDAGKGRRFAINVANVTCPRCLQAVTYVGPFPFVTIVENCEQLQVSRGIAGRTTPPNTSPTLSRVEANANARVMEAAPELLQALKLIHDYWSEGDSSDPALRPGALLGDGDDDRAAIGNIVSAAIAKAEGEQR